MNRKNFLHVLAIMMVAMLSVGFASCGGDDDENEENSTGTTEPGGTTDTGGGGTEQGGGATEPGGGTTDEPDARIRGYWACTETEGWEYSGATLVGHWLDSHGSPSSNLRYEYEVVNGVDTGAYTMTNNGTSRWAEVFFSYNFVLGATFSLKHEYKGEVTSGTFTTTDGTLNLYVEGQLVNSYKYSFADDNPEKMFLATEEYDSNGSLKSRVVDTYKHE